MAITLPNLPYDKNALAPHITENTINFHYGKHHTAYVNNLNGLIQGNELEKLSLEEIIKKTAADTSKKGIFNNAAQIWNHSFYWNSMKPGGGGQPTGKLADMIKSSFGDFAKFKEDFATAAKTLFGSGWAWLVTEGNTLKIVQTANADTPLAHNQKPILTIDVWEHAYYLDYQNRRPDYVATFFDKMVNWDFAAKNI
jgi:Fe-Mn family superoxide dismutase